MSAGLGGEYEGVARYPLGLGSAQNLDLQMVSPSAKQHQKAGRSALVGHIGTRPVCSPMKSQNEHTVKSLMEVLIRLTGEAGLAIMFP